MMNWKGLGRKLPCLIEVLPWYLHGEAEENRKNLRQDRQSPVLLPQEQEAITVPA
jgi:hypothetical protein